MMVVIGSDGRCTYNEGVKAVMAGRWELCEGLKPAGIYLYATTDIPPYVCICYCICLFIMICLIILRHTEGTDEIRNQYIERTP